MKRLSSSLTAASAVIALAVSGFVPAPASVSLFSGAAEARPPSQGSSKGQRGKPRGGAKAKAPAGKQAAKSGKKRSRKAAGKSSKPKTTTVASKAAGTSRPVSKAGNRLAGRYDTKAAIAVTGANMNLSAGSARPSPPPLPPRAAQMTRNKGKAAASPAKQAAKSRKKGARRAQGKTSKPKTTSVAGKQAGPSRSKTKPGKGKTANVAAKPALAVPSYLAAAAPTTPPPVPPRVAQSPRKTGKAAASPAMQAAAKARKEGRTASDISSVVTRIYRPLGGGAPITAQKPQQAKQGKKSKFYFNPFRGLFGGGNKK